ncbi:hypothetical protein [Streptomyces boluensis]|uniref:Uncharacterized protein n=1 Tax=Streptomyces boluensis TaxID=1775135 RepID=A0A964UP41_9ACTN|nr:hypothetical protein [Streptomyces boluensis]NBE51961.1 hypothetical protein [Streptomyces boluensis]
MTTAADTRTAPAPTALGAPRHDDRARPSSVTPIYDALVREWYDGRRDAPGGTGTDAPSAGAAS